MKTKVTYIANDGTEFENKEECLAYEKSFSEMSEFVQLFDQDFLPVEWNPNDYERMWNHTYYIVIEPHREEEVEEWWNNTFCAMLGVSPFGDLERDLSHWLKTNHGDEPTILAFDFCGNDDWVILNNIYHEAKVITKGLNLVDALS
jgi:hypothetical protein